MRIQRLWNQAPSLVSAEQPLMLMHIFKTAGSSLRLRLEQSLRHGSIQGVYASRVWRSRHKRYVPEEELRNTGASLYYGHMFHGAHDLIGVPPSYGVFLRSAVERAASHYGHAERFSTMPPRPLEAYLDERETQFDNLMTRMISGHRSVPFGELREVHLEQAMNNLASYKFIGFVEQFEESIERLGAGLGVPLQSANRINVNDANRQPLPDSSLERLDSLNWADKALYDFARTLE